LLPTTNRIFLAGPSLHQWVVRAHLHTLLLQITFQAIPAVQPVSVAIRLNHLFAHLINLTVLQPGHHRSYSNGQNDNGYSGGYPSQYGQSSRTSNDAYDYTRDGPYVPPGFYHPPPLSAQSHRHFAYQRPQQPSIPPPQPIPHPLIAPQVQQDLPYSPSTSSDSSDEGSYRPSYLHQARSSMPASPSHSQLPPNPHESIHIHIPDEPPHTGGSEPPADVQEEPEHSQTWHETDRYLRNQIGIPEGTRVDLWALPDPPSGHKPQQPLPILVKLAIHGCEKGMLTLQEIYQTLEDRFEYFARLKSSAWKVNCHLSFVTPFLTFIFFRRTPSGTIYHLTRYSAPATGQ
jgi:hypothetical protein